MEKNFFEKEVRRIAKLAYLELTEEKEKEMIEHFRKMYDFVSKLKEVNTENVEMLVYPHDGVSLKMYEDVPKDGIGLLDVMKNAPDTFREYVRTKSPIKEIKSKENKL